MNPTLTPAIHTCSAPLVSMTHGVATTTTLIIAQGTGHHHKNVLELVRTYQTDLEEFGPLAFETRVNSKHSAGQSTENQMFSAFQTRNSQGRPTTFAHLNERQTTLLMTLMRNSVTIVAFKKALVRAFHEMAESLNQSVTVSHTVPISRYLSLLEELYGLASYKIETQGMVNRKSRRVCSKPLDQEEVEQIRALYAQGLSNGLVARQTGRSRSTVGMIKRLDDLQKGVK